ncbi:T9SS type A sorting domain-containing protein [Carboxylicivirga sp. M1479]|uniref:T9SS type A sorting domain-containing protein n=1 Tax=Carboxylicivirga sp. M1479 TaxID=2594476 RepID=UPI001178108F|nr:T9SS type A sorting domain-containing protein [Carboxylicivirga sp. M1479]TRX71779.1 T9SS type A sorting domain-containing protein [Carboxylicivirga sp. M1479]
MVLLIFEYYQFTNNIDLPSPEVEGADFKYWLSSNYTDAWFVANNVPTTKAYEAIYNETTTTTDIDPSPSTEEKLLIYPNPSTGIITIQCNRKITNLVLTDLSGRIVAQKACAHRVNDLNISAYPTGVYLLVAKDGKAIVGQQKVIKP